MADAGRLSAAMEAAIQGAATRLVPGLLAANTATYLRTVQTIATTCGRPVPHAVTDAAELATLADRAAASARSIAHTQADRMRALVTEHGSRAAASGPFRAWDREQRALIAQAEAATAASAAHAAFLAHNAVTGTEHVEPVTAIGSECQAAIALGEVPLGTLPDFPLHLRCPHYVVTTLVIPDGPLWLGGEVR